MSQQVAVPGIFRGGHKHLTILDWVGLGLVWPSVTLLLVAPFTTVPAFARMFEDMGGAATLPGLTRLVLAPWFPPVLALPALGLAYAAVSGTRPLGRRRLFGVLAVVAGAAGVAVLFAGLYMPIVELAGAIRAEP